jgi:hypothetical protein
MGTSTSVLNVPSQMSIIIETPISIKFKHMTGSGGKLPHRLKANRDRQHVNPEPHQRALVRYNKNHPERKAATVAVNNAVRDGRLTKQPCEVCGNPKAEAHHDDYSKPLDVRWLCNPHHKVADAERRLKDGS